MTWLNSYSCLGFLYLGFFLCKSKVYLFYTVFCQGTSLRYISRTGLALGHPTGFVLTTHAWDDVLCAFLSVIREDCLSLVIGGLKPEWLCCGTLYKPIFKCFTVLTGAGRQLMFSKTHTLGFSDGLTVMDVSLYLPVTFSSSLSLHLYISLS